MIFLPAHIYLVAFLLLEESLHTKRRSGREDGGSNHERDGTWNGTAASLETEDSSSSLQSGDSGIELSGGMKTIDSDTNLQPDMNDNELITMESDIDTDSDFETIDSDTKLLLKTQRDSKNLDGSKAHLYSSRFFNNSVSSCLARECGPRQCYGRVRNSLMDSCDCVVVCTERLKSCVNYSKQWTPGEVKGQGKAKLRKAWHSMLNLFRLILDRRVFLSTLLYALLAFFTIMCNEVSSWIAIRYIHFKEPL